MTTEEIGTAQQAAPPVVGPHYKWVVLSNTTVGVLLATLNGTSLMIALPVIFRGIHLDPLQAANFPYLLWIMMGYVLVSAAVVVTVGRIGDMFGRTKMYNLGFAWFTLGAVLLSAVWSTGSTAALELVILRMFQAIGGALLMANSAAIITDAFPAEQLGLALGMNMVAGILGFVLWDPRRWAAVAARVALGVPGQRAGRGLRDGLGLLETEGDRRPYQGQDRLAGQRLFRRGPGHGPHRGHLRHQALRALAHGLGGPVRAGDDPRRPSAAGHLRLRRDEGGRADVPLVAVPHPGVHRRQRGVVPRGDRARWLAVHVDDLVPGHLAAPARLQLHQDPAVGGDLHDALHARFCLRWALSGKLSDRYGARPFATSGMLVSAAMYLAMMAFPANFSYWPFAAVMFVSGVGGGLFASPNTASIMNSVPARHRGAASGMRVTFAQVGMPLSMGLFFTLLVFGLNAKVPSAMYQGLVAHGVPAASATKLSHLPPLGYLFAAFLGLNPLKSLIGPKVLAHLAPAQASALTSRAFFPQLIGPSFKHGLVIILAFAVAMSLIAAVASALRGDKFIHEDDESRAQKAMLTAAATSQGSPARGGDGTGQRRCPHAGRAGPRGRGRSGADRELSCESFR